MKHSELPYWFHYLVHKSMFMLWMVCAGTTIGCMTPGDPLDPPWRSESKSANLTVPFFSDDSDQCGPVALASVMVYWGSVDQPEDLKEEVYLRSIQGSLPFDLLLAAQRRGFAAISFRGDMNHIIADIDAGHPLIALIDSGSWIFSRGHFVVITGYDSVRGGLYVHSGTKRDMFVAYEQFLPAWNKTDRWTLRVVPIANDNLSI